MDRRWFLVAMLLVVLPAGCAGPPPRLFPVAPLAVNPRPDGGEEHRYDTDGDGRADYREIRSGAGRVTTLGYDTDGDGRVDLDIELAAIPDEQRRHLLIVLDSIPFDMVADLWDQGRLRCFPRPSRVISPFPVMTDLCLSEFFGGVRCPGIESAYFDGEQLTNGYAAYAAGDNVPWHRFVDYRLNPILHSFSYLRPLEWCDHELRRIQQEFHEQDRPMTVGYVVGTSALGARIGRDGHQTSLIRVDRLCQQLMYDTRGKIRITLMSDHGHHMSSTRRIPLSDLLETFGYRVGGRLERPTDVVVPEFGMVTCAAIHTRVPARVARDLVGADGIELTAYVAGDDGLVVLSRHGRARIEHSEAGFRYAPVLGDPLHLKPLLQELAAAGRVDPDGFVADRVLFDATVDADFPDGVYRLWRAFHGLVEHTPDVLVSVLDGYHCGSAGMTAMVDMTAAHGNLRPPSSTGFAVTTAGPLPPVVRMVDLRTELQALGVPVPGGGSPEPSSALSDGRTVAAAPPFLSSRVIQ